MIQTTNDCCPNCGKVPFNGIKCTRCKRQMNAEPVMSPIAQAFQHRLLAEKNIARFPTRGGVHSER